MTEPMTKGVGRIDWAALAATVGSTVLFTVLLSSPFIWGAHYGQWLLAFAAGIVLGAVLYVRRDRYDEPGPDADETRFP